MGSTSNSRRLGNEAAGPASLVLCLAVLLLVAGELASSLRDWRNSNHGDFVRAAIDSTILLSFFWLTILLLLSVFSGFLGWFEFKVHTRAGLPIRLLAAFVVCAAWNLIVISLVVNYILGSFLNFPLLEFAAINMREGFFDQLVSWQRWTLVGLAIFLVFSTVLIFCKVVTSAAHLNLLASPRPRRILLGLWLVLAAGLTYSAVTFNREHEQDKGFRNRLVSHLSYKLDPLINFGVNGFNFYRQSRMDDTVLDESSLTRRSVTVSQPTALHDKPNIIFLQIESLRGDLVGQVSHGIEIVPNINRLARSGTWFTKGYAAASHTSLSSPSIPSSLYPLRSDLLLGYKTNDPRPKTLIYDVLKPCGYSTAYIASDIESWRGMDNFLTTPSLDVMVDATSRKHQELRLHPEQTQGSKGGLSLVPDNITMRTAIEWMDDKITENKPFYLTVSLSDSEFPYKSSYPDAKWFQPSGVPDDTTYNGYPAALKDQVRNTYLNAIHGVDLQIGRLLDFLQDRGADKHTIIVVYGDHGESFCENGQPARANLPYDSSVHTCLIMNGQGYFPAQKEDYPASLIDAVPTVLARLGLPLHPNFQGIDVLSSNRPPVERRCIYMHVDGLANADGILAAGHWKYFEDNGKGDTYLYDLSCDPDEKNNLVESHPDVATILSAQLNTWRTDQLAYYREARYYTQFYPPPPPMLKEKTLQ